jgi:hypothetical protein
MFRLYQPKAWRPQSAILAIDEATLARLGGMRRTSAGRWPMALRLVAAARPGRRGDRRDRSPTRDDSKPRIDRALASGLPAKRPTWCFRPC